MYAYVVKVRLAGEKMLVVVEDTEVLGIMGSPIGFLTVLRSSSRILAGLRLP